MDQDKAYNNTVINYLGNIRCLLAVFCRSRVAYSVRQITTTEISIPVDPFLKVKQDKPRKGERGSKQVNGFFAL